MTDRTAPPSQLRRGGLGRGLESLIPTGSSAPVHTGGAVAVRVTDIDPNPYQPRSTMNTDRLAELADSIRTHGVIQPLIVRVSERPDRFTLIAGERRLRASQLAGLEHVPVIVKDAADQAMLELALVENVVRADLSPLEEAHAYRQLIEEFGLTQASVAARVGRSRVSVTNTLRLLNAPTEVLEALEQGLVTEGHARALLGLPSAIDQVAVLRQVVQKGLTVRQTEELSRARSDREAKAPRPAPSPRSEVAERLQRTLQTKVSVRGGPDGGGVLTIHYFTDEQLADLYRRLSGEVDDI